MALSEYEASMFEAVLEADGFHLLESELDGVTVGVLAVEVDDGEGEAAEGTFRAMPVAILMSESVAERLTPPETVEIDDTDVPGVSSSDPPE